jgi:hypothetical protein
MTSDVMTEAKWDTCADPIPMLRCLPSCPRLTPRTARLFAAALCRRIWGHISDGRSRRSVEVAERHADSLASDAELAEAAQAAGSAKDEAAVARAAPWESTTYAAWRAAYDPRLRMTNAPEHLTVLEALHGVSAAAAFAVDPPEQIPVESFSPGAMVERAAQAELMRDLFGSPFRTPPDIDPNWLAWDGGTVRRLAESAYLERPLPSGALDPARLGVLADALEDAGCANGDILSHLRGPGPHVRGCWALDLILGKS